MIGMLNFSRELSAFSPRYGENRGCLTPLPFRIKGKRVKAGIAHG